MGADALVTCSANDLTKRNNKKTIMAKDVLDAIDIIEFPDFRPRLEAELASSFSHIWDTVTPKMSNHCPFP